GPAAAIQGGYDRGLAVRARTKRDSDRPLVGATAESLLAGHAGDVRVGEGAGRGSRVGLVVRSGTGGSPPTWSTFGAAYAAGAASWSSGPGQVYRRLAELLVAFSPVPLGGR